jgi:hypothetical protein
MATDEERIKALRVVLKEIAYKRPPGPVRLSPSLVKLVEYMELAAIYAIRADNDARKEVSDGD